MNLPVEGLGETAGSIIVKLGGISLKSRIEKWDAQGITFVAPEIDLVEASRATLYVRFFDGSVYTELPFMLAPALTSETQPEALTARR